MLKDMQEVQANKNSQRELFLPPPLSSGQSLALDFSHNRLLHFEYVTPQIVGVSVAAAVALNLHYTYPPENCDAGGDFMGIRARGPGGTRDHGIPARVSAANAYIGRQTFAARSLLLLLLLPLHKNSNFASGQSQSNNEPKYCKSRLVNTQGKYKNGLNRF